MESNKQASFTGKQRRDLVPFLWYAVLGLHGTKEPDLDELVRAALQLDWIQAELRSINRDSKRSKRTAEEIMNVQRPLQLACDDIQRCFKCDETTKFHRLRVHVADHIKRYGNSRSLDTSANEALHKGVKQTNYATNKRIWQITPQLLQMNAAVDRRKYFNDTAQTCVLLMTRSPRSASVNPGSLVPPTSTEFQELQDCVELEAVRVLMKLKTSAADRALSPKQVVDHMLNCKDCFGNKMYERKRSMTLEAALNGKVNQARE